MQHTRYFATVLLLALTAASPARAANFSFSYSGRFISDNGKPVEGPVAMKVAFYHVETGGTPVLEVEGGLQAVPLQEGVFQINLSLAPTDYQTAFPSVLQAVYVEITDLTHAPTRPYARQQISLTPFAGKVPVDDKTMASLASRLPPHLAPISF